MEMTGLKPDSDRIIEVALVVTDAGARRRRRGAGTGRPPGRRHARRDGLVESVDARPQRAHRQGEGVDPDRDGRRGAHARVPARARPSQGLADVRQHHLPGSSIPGPLDAGARGLLPLPQPRRVDVEGALQALAARHRQGWTKQGKHEALADIYESIDELKYYREHFIKAPRVVKFCSHCGSAQLDLQGPRRRHAEALRVRRVRDDPLSESEGRGRLPAGVGGPRAAVQARDRAAARAVDAARGIPRERRDAGRRRAARNRRGSGRARRNRRALHHDQPAAHQPGLRDVSRAAASISTSPRGRRASRSGCSRKRTFPGISSRFAPSPERCATYYLDRKLGEFPVHVSALDRRSGARALAGGRRLTVALNRLPGQGFTVTTSALHGRAR